MKPTRRIRPTRSRKWRRTIERRIEAAEGQLDDLSADLGDVQFSVDELAGVVRRHHPQRPPTTEPPSSEWPRVPEVYVGLAARDDALQDWTFTSGDLIWEVEDSYRHSTTYAILSDLTVYVWREQWRGYDATRTTIAIVNGFAGRGTAYLQVIKLAVDGILRFTSTSNNCILPRGTFLRRYHIGPDSDKLIRWEHVEPFGPTLDWIPALCEQGRQQSINSALTIGPYRIGDPEVSGSGSLNGSEGGRRIAPFWGGEDGWQATCREGLRWMAEDWFYTLARSPIALLDRAGMWRNPHVPYWAGSTVAHEPDGYEIVDVPLDGSPWKWKPLNGWCPYEAQLREYRAHDYTHYRRGYAAAAAVARHDIAARWFLTMLWGNLAAWLDGAPSDLSLLQHMPQMLATPEHEGDSRGGRGWGHTLGCFLAVEDWLPEELEWPSWGGTWLKALLTLTEHWALPENGWTHATSKGAFPTPADGWGDLDSPITASRELDLVGVWYSQFELERLDAAWKRSLSPVYVDETWTSVGEHLETRAVGHWTEVHSRGPNAQPQYDLFRGEFGRWGGIDEVIEAANEGTVSPNELLLDNLPRQEWQKALTDD